MKGTCDKCGGCWDSSLKGMSSIEVKRYTGTVFPTKLLLRFCKKCTQEFTENLYKGEQKCLTT